ncbi:chitin deacetylase 1 [Plutella xylostella]|uniref:chitin deacetylase 1 n=1 Tax=Plutella xylostella TaxID=51655 RepID=UPI002032A80E|nr:chitin deacetylase 1 [Plutella xylostella]
MARPRHLSRLLTAVTFAYLCSVALGKEVNKRSLDSDVKCQESGRFYRNPNRPRDKQWSTAECAKYYLCLEGEIFEFRCSQGLMFDVNRQLCDMQQNVHNCDVTTEILIPRPALDKAACANATHLGCADGSCQPAEYFCDGSHDCPDSSDESWCEEHDDPNAAAPCRADGCQPPDCFCSPSGDVIPGNLAPNQTPQMITLTFDGPVNHENWELYTKHIFATENQNPNGCEIKATFFVPHSYTNYRHVQKLWNDGHEIAINSITHRGPEEWWTKNATIEEWFDEMVGQANIINRFANVRMEDFRGMRVPYLSVGWNRQFLMMQEFGFVYDASIVAPVNETPYWPYTLDYKIPHKCTGNNQLCPTRSYAGLWEMVINPLTTGEHTCATLDYCPSTLSADDTYNLLMENFKRHYLTNRAPFGIHLNSKWLKSQNYLAAFKRFLTDMLRLPDVYFVTYNQVIEWMKRPTTVHQIKKFQPWQCKPRYLEDLEVACAKPNTCKLSSRVLELDKYMITCNECPRSYPWLRNEFGFD